MIEVVAISHPTEVENEVEEVIKMIDLGLRHFHVRKPKLSRRALSAYIKSFPAEYHGNLILHSYHSLADQYKVGGLHLSRSHRKRNWTYRLRLWIKRKSNPELAVTRTFHKLTDLMVDKRTYDYAFLSPIFDSVSQNSLGGGYSRRALLIMLPLARQPIYAMGGVHPGKLKEVSELGFHGAVMLGALWKGDERPHEVFRKALENAKCISTE